MEGLRIIKVGRVVVYACSWGFTRTKLAWTDAFRPTICKGVISSLVSAVN